MHLHAHKLCGAHELCTRAEPCDCSAGAQGVTTMLGVSLRASRHTTQVMLGVSLRASYSQPTHSRYALLANAAACVGERHGDTAMDNGKRER